MGLLLLFQTTTEIIALKLHLEIENYDSYYNS